jgi:hypothetical protein
MPGWYRSLRIDPLKDGALTTLVPLIFLAPARAASPYACVGHSTMAAAANSSMMRGRPVGLVAPEVLKPGGSQLRVSDRVLDVLMPEVGLKRSGVVAVICELIAARMPEHVGVSLDIKADVVEWTGTTYC